MNIALCIPAYRDQVHVGHVVGNMRLVGAMSMRDDFRLTGFYFVDSCSVPWARNVLLHKAMKGGADWVLMADADTYHVGPSDTMNMLLAGEAEGAAVIAAPVKQRRSNGIYNTLVRQADGSPRRLEKKDFEGRVVPVDRIGTGYFAINAKWIKDIWPDQPWFFEHQMRGSEPLKMGSDIAFCDEVRQRGGLILADGRFEPEHHGA